MTEEKVKQRPIVSVILAVYNEADFIKRSMASLLEQEAPDFDLEILAVDGGSNDGTREYLEKLASTDWRVRVLHNRQKTAPFAFNMGLREAKGEYVCIFGAHAVYAKDYVSVCLRELLVRDVVGCGARILTEPASKGLQARLVALALAHPFGSSGKSVRTRSEGYTDAGYMVLRKKPLMEVGGYSEEMSRNQDNDTYQKLRDLGYRFYCTWKTQCVYYPKSTIKGILAYAYRTGFWNGISLGQNPRSMAPRHLIPFAFVMSLLVSALFGAVGAFLSFPHRELAFAPLAVFIGMHLAVGTLAGLQVAWREKYFGALALPFVFFAFHFSYGFGTLWALLSRAKPPRVGSRASGLGKALQKATARD